MTMNLLFLLVLAVTMETTYSRHVIDLTHTLDEDSPKWPLGDYNGSYFKREILHEQYTESNTWFAVGTIDFFEHIGTHMDAPKHFGKGRHSLDEVPLDKLIGAGVVINVRPQAKSNPDYAVSVQDIYRYENIYGRIQPKSIVMMNSGWSEKFPNQNLMFGTDDVRSGFFHFPGFSYEACIMLLQERQVSVVGSDTPSLDVGQNRSFPCHVYLNNNNVPLLENIANLDSIPANGTTIMLGAMKVRGASGAPVRILAFIDKPH